MQKIDILQKSVNYLGLLTDISIETINSDIHINQTKEGLLWV